MERILRSVVQHGGQPSSDDAHQNWNRLLEFDIEFKTEEDNKVYKYIEEFYQSMSAPPDIVLMREFFEKKDDVESVSRIDEFKSAQPYVKQNFLAIVRSELEQQQIKRIALVCKDVVSIAETGKVIKVGLKTTTLRGVADAINYLFEKTSELTQVESGEKSEGVISDDIEEVLEEHDLVAKSNKYAGRNIFGLDPIDSVCQGHRNGEFWVHTAFTGELKSTLAVNYAYNNVMLFNKNIMYCILEMPYKQLRRQFAVVHSSHGKFVTDWFNQDKKNGVPIEKCYRGIDYRSVRDGNLNELERKRFQIVAQDFKANTQGKLFVWRPVDDVMISSIKRKAEAFHNKWGCDGLVIDHLGLVQPKHRTADHVTTLNGVIRDARMLALNFARGKGLPLLGLFQLNRQGKLRAEKNDGRYDMSAISYANEVEKSADVITYTYLDEELRKEGKFYCGNLKNRDNPLFERFVGKIVWQSKRMRHLESGLIDMSTDSMMNAMKQMTNVAVTHEEMLASNF